MRSFFCLAILTLPFAGLRAQPGEPVRLAAVPRPMYWENTPVHFETIEGKLVIQAGEKTDMFRDPNVTYNTDNAPKLLFIADSNFVLTAATANTIYYKIAKAGNVITLYFSTEGKSWYLIRHLVFDSSGPLKLGFLAQSPTGKSCRVTFSDIHYSTKKISDPYLGE